MTELESCSENSHRELLISAAIDTIARHGISRVTLSSAAAIGKVSADRVKFCFKSEKQLLLSTLEHLEHEFIHILNANQTNANIAEERLHGYIHSCFDRRVFEKGKIAAWLAFRSESQAINDYRKIFRRVDQITSEIVHQSIFDILSETSQSTQYCNELAIGLQGIVNQLWQQLLASCDEIDRLQAIRSCERYLAHCQSQKGTERESLNTSKLNLESSDLLPFWTYQDQEFFDLEIETLFKPNWMLVGHVSEIPYAGDYLTFHGFGERALVLRSKNGDVNAFHNICRHRGSTLLVGQGRCRQSITCPFHGWRYDFDGNLQFVPIKESFPNVDPKHYSLKPVDLEIWHGFIFIRFKSGGQSVRGALKPLEPHIQEYRLEQMQPYQEPGNYSLENPDKLSVNWKIFHDIDNEGYHVPIGHPSLQQLYGHSYHDTEVEGIPMSLGKFNKRNANLWSVRNYQKLMPEFSHLSDNRQDLWLYFGVFPNLVFGLYPELMEVYMSLPVNLTTTEVINKCYALPDNRKGIKAIRYLNRRINAITSDEDYFYMNSMQEGLSSSAYPQWTLSETAETGIRAYHHAIQAQLPVAKLRYKPNSGTIAEVNSLLANGLRKNSL